MRFRQVTAGDTVPGSWAEGGWARPLCGETLQSGFRWACATCGVGSFDSLAELQEHVASPVWPAAGEAHGIVARCGVAGHGAEGPRP